MVKIIRDKKPLTCECWVTNKKTKMLMRCTNEIAFINGSSGYFICIECTNRFHKRFPKYGKKFKDAAKYLRLWFHKTDRLDK